MIPNYLTLNKGYPTNLTDNQWQFLEKTINPTSRKRKNSLRDIMNALQYQLLVKVAQNLTVLNDAELVVFLSMKTLLNPHCSHDEHK